MKWMSDHEIGIDPLGGAAVHTVVSGVAHNSAPDDAAALALAAALVYVARIKNLWVSVGTIVLQGVLTVAAMVVADQMDLPQGWRAALAGAAVPRLPPGSLPTVAAVLGAVVMPHGIFLHSEVVQSRARHAAAVAEVPSLADEDAGIRAAFDALATTPWPDLQRVHGDYHLGQTLSAGDGWVIEYGEYPRPMMARRFVRMIRPVDQSAASRGMGVTPARWRRPADVAAWQEAAPA